MTLILAAGNPHQMIQVADRRFVPTLRAALAEVG